MLLVETSVWFLALRRGTSENDPEVAALKDALAGATPAPPVADNRVAASVRGAHSRQA